MTVSQVCRQWRLLPDVGAWRMQQALKQAWPAAKPGTTTPPLPLRLAERGSTHQGFPRVRPTVRVRSVLVVLRQPPLQTRRERRHRGKVPATQQLPGQHAEEQLHLVQPRAVDGGEMEDVAVAGVTQEGTPLPATAQFLLPQWHPAPPRHQ